MKLVDSLGIPLADDLPLSFSVGSTRCWQRHIDNPFHLLSRPDALLTFSSPSHSESFSELIRLWPALLLLSIP